MSYYNENVMKLIDNIITRLPYTQKKMVKYTAYNRKTSCLFHYAYVSRTAIAKDSTSNVRSFRKLCCNR